jgi:hypothetical protein
MRSGLKPIASVLAREPTVAARDPIFFRARR